MNINKISRKLPFMKVICHSFLFPLRNLKTTGCNLGPIVHLFGQNYVSPQSTLFHYSSECLLKCCLWGTKDLRDIRGSSRNWEVRKPSSMDINCSDIHTLCRSQAYVRAITGMEASLKW